MIRRSENGPDGTPRWTLISQVEHARLAGEMAQAWGRAPLSPPEPRDEIVPAVFHHDDGWAEWEQSPDVGNGRPLDFTEMPLAISLAIWQRSIDVAERIGPLAAWIVSGHFSGLLRHSNAWQHTGNHPAGPLARTFLAAQDEHRSRWLAAWQQVSPTVHTPAMAEQGLKFLQFFDALSLWLCCAPRHEPHQTAVPAGPAIRFCPQSTGEIVVTPWPWTEALMRLSLVGRSISQAGYDSPEALAAAPSQPVTLVWRLVKSP